MSLVAYGSSDESDNEEEVHEQSVSNQPNTSNAPVQHMNKSSKLQLPTPKIREANNINGETKIETNLPSAERTENISANIQQSTAKEQITGHFNDVDSDEIEDEDEPCLNFNVLPEPKAVEADLIKEADNAPIPKKIDYGVIEKPPKKEKGPVKISIPSLSDFKDLEEEDKPSGHKIKPSQKGSGLIGILPPPKGSVLSTKPTIVPQVLTTRKPIETKTTITRTVIKKPISQINTAKTKKNFLSSYNSDSEDDDDKESATDFFSLTTSSKIPDEQLMTITNIDLSDIATQSSSHWNSVGHNVNTNSEEEESEANKKLTSNVMNLPKEEILLKNKAEVGPKLPIPEQEYHLDSEGNVAFDEKAIEYLCGRRGVKRKNELSNVDIVEISGDDIKPDERDWLVKALTEEPIHRPISAGSGPGGQSKKKHQITYLAHQAKAMELELKNQWAQNKANRQQTRSKYGF